MARAYAIVVMFSICSTASAVEPPTRGSGDLAIRVRGILQKYCAGCHDGKDKFDILDYAAVMREHPVPFAAKNGRSQIIEFIEDGSMPPGGKRRPSLVETETLKTWIAAGAPQYPKAFDDAYVLNAVERDWRMQNSPGDFRYISFAHTIKEESTGVALEETRLRAALASDRTLSLEPVDGAPAIFRLDIKKLGWLSQELFQSVDLKGKGYAHGLRPFDLISIENPFPIVDARFNNLAPSSFRIPQSPFLRGDWLADTLAPGSPLADEMKSLVELAAKVDDPPCGPKLRAFELTKPALGGKPSVHSWYRTDAPDEFAVEFSVKGPNPGVLVGDPLELVIKPTRNGWFRLLNLQNDGSLKILPVSGGETLKANERRQLLTVSNTPFRISSIVSGADKATEAFILIASEAEVPMPTIVRSQHNATLECIKQGRAPIYRFLFEDVKFDPSKAVRKVVAINIAKKK